MRLVGKLLVVAGVASGLAIAAQFSERRSVASWTAPAPAAAVVESAPARRTTGTPATAPAAKPEPAQAAVSPGCTDAVWPNIPKECIIGRVEAARAERPAPRPLPAVETAAAPKPAPAEVEPASTGSVAAGSWPEVPSVATLHPYVPAAPKPRVVRQARRPPPAMRIAAQDPYGATRLREPIQVRLADRN